MHKFASLVKNEIIKLTKRKGTLVMTILFLACIIGFTGLCKIVGNSRVDETDWRQEAFQDGQVAGNIEYYGQLYEDSIVRDENGHILSSDMEFKQLYEYWTYLSEQEIRYDDWMYRNGLYEQYCGLKFALENGLAGDFAYEYQAEIAKIESYMKTDGWKVYYQDKISELQNGYTGTDKDAQLWFYRYSIDREIAPESGERYTLLLSVLESKTSLAELTAKLEAGEEVSSDRISELQDEVTLGVYRLDNNIIRDISAEVKNSSLFEISEINLWSVFAACKTLIKLVGVMCIVIAGSIIASEFSQGTYKFLLMSPAKRWKILVAKFVTVILFGIAMMAVLYLLSLLCCILFFGVADLSLPLLSVQNGMVVTNSPLLSIIGDYLLSSIEILAMTMLAFAISALVKGNALAISVSLLAFFSGTLMETILRSFGVDFGRYLIFANLNLPALYAGTEFYAGQTFGFAVMVILCHLIVFGWTAWDAFTRREM